MVHLIETTGKAVATKGALPTMSDAGRMARDMEWLSKTWLGVYSGEVPNPSVSWPPKMRVDEAWLVNAREEAGLVAARLRPAMEAAALPATRAQIATHLAVLVGSMAGNVGDGAVFAKALEVDIGDLQPTAGAVEHGCRALRRTKTFLPSIGEVLEAVAKAQPSPRPSHCPRSGACRSPGRP